MPAAAAPPWAMHLPPDVRWQDVDLLCGKSVPAVTGAWAKRAPQVPILYQEGKGWLTRGELQDQSAIVAGRFARAGLHRGDRVLFSAAASTSLVVAHVAALRLGLVVVPANTAYQPAELLYIATDAGVRAAVMERDLKAGIPVVTPDVELPDAPPPALDDHGPGDLAMICYTSGTTGRPKGAALTHGNLLASSEAVRLAWRWTPDDRLVLALPLFHAHGLLVGLHGTLVAGASTVLLPRFDPGAVADAVAAHDATLFFGVPTMYRRIAASPRAGELRRLRLCVSGSAPLPADLHAEFRARTGHVVLERYGMTETLMLTSNPYDGERRAGTVGLPLPGVEIRLAGEGAGELAGELGGSPSGEILARGPNVFHGYWGDPAMPGAAFDDGWFRTGDIGALDGHGYLRIVGRAKELIITGGLNVYPREVEDVLLGHPSVADVAVVGLPSDEWGEEVTAFVVPRPGRQMEEGELIDFARGHLARFKCPRRVRLVPGLPRNTLGKILREELR
jgi:malonyl-CoA/methylmalonyl-CoA synthetase